MGGDSLTKSVYIFFHTLYHFVWFFNFVEDKSEHILRSTTLWIVGLLLIMGRHIPILLPIFQCWILISPFLESILPSFLSSPTLITPTLGFSICNHHLGVLRSLPLHCIKLQTLCDQDSYSKLRQHWRYGCLFPLYSWTKFQVVWCSWPYFGPFYCLFQYSVRQLKGDRGKMVLASVPWPVDGCQMLKAVDTILNVNHLRWETIIV